MAFTQDQLDALDVAIAQGVKEVWYGDKKVTYNSVSDMLRIRQLMAEELGLINRKRENKLAAYNSGFGPCKQYPE